MAQTLRPAAQKLEDMKKKEDEEDQHLADRKESIDAKKARRERNE